MPRSVPTLSANLGFPMSLSLSPRSGKGFGRYKEEAQHAITSYGRVSGYFISAREFEELQMDPAHDHLNKLLTEK